ncbi:hypothetical protein AM500_12450 [Bacillus sp. FJAT-18017]|nr:hypothetical protein AM500_12450 [Bacillus sp. FJAT-18017]
MNNNLNQRAIELLEENRFDESLKLFHEAVKSSRDVQSLNNLAWIYCYEEDDDSKAIPLLKEAIKMQPHSHFPYNMLGEVYVRREKWEEARNVLQKVVSIHPTKTAFYNLATAYYKLGKLEAAADSFLRGSEPSDLSLYSHIKCLAELGRKEEAFQKLSQFSEEDDHFVGEIDVADLYVELGDYKMAIYWFSKGWETYAKDPTWLGRYIFALLKADDLPSALDIQQEVIKEIEERIAETNDDCDEEWTPAEKEDYIRELTNHQREYAQIIDKIHSGYTPPMDFSTSVLHECYLFGCDQHNNPEYTK